MKRIKKILVITLCFLLSFPAAAANAADYTVVANDSLFKISQLFNTSVDTLKQDNYISSNTINPGQVLYVPSHVYTVKSGDTIYLIATRYKIPVASLRKANNKWDDKIIIGQKLVIPGVQQVKTSDNVISYTSSDVDLLARLIEAEAGGESLQAKIAVGAVVVNRVQRKQWASTITGVINQKIDGYYQFTPVKNGTIRNTASSASVKAAWTALYGADPSNGAIYYFDQTCTNQWLWSKPQTAQIGHLVFVK